MQKGTFHTRYYLSITLQRSWFGLLLVLSTLLFSLLLPARVPQKIYQASLLIRVLPFGGLHEQELSTSFFAQFFTSPASLSLVQGKHPELSLRQLTNDIIASPIAQTNLILLKAHASTVHEAGQLVLDLYHILLQRFIEIRGNLSREIKASLEHDLRLIAGTTPAQSQRQHIINKLLANLHTSPADLLSLGSSSSPELVDITPHAPDRQQVPLFAILVGASLGSEACLRAHILHKSRGSVDKYTIHPVLTRLSYTLFALGCTWILTFSLVAGIGCMLALQVTSLLFAHIRYALPLYVAIAGPSIGLGASMGGILSRIFIGNLLFCILIVIWLTRSLLTGRSLTRTKVVTGSGKNRLLIAPLAGLTGCGLFSIAASRLFPDPQVTYSFIHSNISIALINISEASILLGLPLLAGLVPGLIKTRRDVQLLLTTYLSVGLIYTLGTLFAPVLGLVSSETLLGNQRPVIFGAISSGLGNLLALFACVAFGLCLHASSRVIRVGYFCLFCLFVTGVLFSLGREAWLALLLAICTMLGIWNRKSLLFILPFLLLLLAVLASGAIDFFNPQKVYGSDRLAIWQDALTIWQRSPYFGVGAGNYQFFDLSYGSDIVGVAHNQYLEVLAEMGLQGVICLIWFLIVLGQTLYHHFHTSTTSLAKSIALAGIGCYLTIIFGGFFTDTLLPSAAAGGGMGPFITTSYRWLLLGLALSIPRWENLHEKPAARHSPP